MKLYLAGPMTGIPKFNFPAFDDAAAYLRSLGHEIVSPAELDDPATREAALASEDGAPGSGAAGGETYGEFLARDLKIVIDDVEGVVTLPGWQDSTGASIEVYAADKLSKPVFDYAPTTTTGPARGGREATEFAVPLPATPPAMMADIPATLWGMPVRVDSRLDPNEFRIEFRIEKPTPLPEGSASNPPEFASVAQIRDAVHARGEERPDGEVRITSETGGQKGSKPERLDLIPTQCLLELARVYGEGAKKYSDTNYLKGYGWRLSIAAMQRHIAAWVLGESIDPECGTHHLAHAAWHCFTLMSFERYGLGTDDRIETALAAGTLTHEDEEAE